MVSCFSLEGIFSSYFLFGHKDSSIYCRVEIAEEMCFCSEAERTYCTVFGNEMGAYLFEFTAPYEIWPLLMFGFALGITYSIFQGCRNVCH